MNLTFLGSGNIARAIIGGLVAGGTKPSDITAADPFPAALDEAAKLGIKTTDNNHDAVASADVLVISVKPNIVPELAQSIASDVGERLLISVAAGITTASLSNWLTPETHIVRCMPNTPAQIQSGITGLYATPQITETERNIAEEILSAVGETIWVQDESDLNAVTAVSGSGPAYFFYMMEVMQEAAIGLGLSPGIAQKLVLETALGASKMAHAEIANKPPAQLRREVTSPGGTTEAALNVLLARDLSGVFRDAIRAANARSIELAKDA